MRTPEHQLNEICKQNLFFIMIISCCFWGETWPCHVFVSFAQRMCLGLGSAIFVCILPHILRTCWCLQREHTVGVHHHGVLIMHSQARLKEKLNLERSGPCAHRPDNECVSSLSCNQTLMKSLHAGGALISHCSRTPRGSASTSPSSCFNTAFTSCCLSLHVSLTWTPSFVSSHETYCVLFYILFLWFLIRLCIFVL